MRKHLEPELSDPRRTAQVERRLSSLFHSFENETKRNFVMEDDPEEFEYFDFEDLKPNVVRGFGQDMIKLSKLRPQKLLLVHFVVANCC